MGLPEKRADNMFNCCVVVIYSPGAFQIDFYYQQLLTLLILQ